MKEKIAEKNLENFVIIIEKIPQELGGGYTAYIPELGKYAFVGDGESKKEALESLKNIFKYLQKKYSDL